MLKKGSAWRTGGEEIRPGGQVKAASAEAGRRVKAVEVWVNWINLSGRVPGVSFGPGNTTIRRIVVKIIKVINNRLKITRGLTFFPGFFSPAGIIKGVAVRDSGLKGTLAGCFRLIFRFIKGPAALAFSKKIVGSTRVWSFKIVRKELEGEKMIRLRL